MSSFYFLKMTSSRIMNAQILPSLVVIIGLLHVIPTVTSLDGSSVTYAQPNELNFVAALAYSNRHIPRVFNVFCSGVLVSRRHVLTNEHCINDEKHENLVVYVGSNNLQDAEEHTVCEWVFHHKYFQMMHQQPLNLGVNDIAIVQLCKNVGSETLVPPVLSTLTFDELQASWLTISGWGLARDQRVARLQKGTVRLLDQATCQERGDLRAIARSKLFCTTANPYASGCQGDSGGPILDKNNGLVGITSCLVKQSDDPGEAMNVHVNVTSYKKFITTIVNNLYYFQNPRG